MNSFGTLLGPEYYDTYPQWRLEEGRFSSNYTRNSYPYICYAPNNKFTNEIFSGLFESIPTNVTTWNQESEIDDSLRKNYHSSLGIFLDYVDNNGNLAYKLKEPCNDDGVTKKFERKYNDMPINLEQKISEMVFLTTVQYQINNKYIQLMCDMNSFNCGGVIKPISIYRMPYPKYSESSLGILSIYYITGLTLTFAYIINFPLMVNRIVDEKNTKMKALMRMNGMPDLAYWMSHFFINFFILIFHCVFMNWMLFLFDTPILANTSGKLTFFVLFLYCLQVLFFAMFLSTFFTK